MNVDKDTCIGCGACAGVCPVEALAFDDDGKMECDIHVTLTSREDEKLIQHFLIKKQKLNNYTIRTDWYYSNVQIALKSECQDNELKLKITSY